MPISNGLITARDIRQKAVQTLHLVDSAVTTAKILDLAVTLEKDDHVVEFFTDKSFADDVSLDTTVGTSHTTVSVPIPAHIGSAAIFTVVRSMMRNSSGGVQAIYAAVGVAGEYQGYTLSDVSNNEWGSAVHIDTFMITAPGSSVTLNAMAWVSTGTNADNVVTIWTLMVGTR